MKKQILFLFLLVLLSFTSHAVKPTTPLIQSTTDGLRIGYPKIEIYKYNVTEIKLHFHIYNQTNYILSNTSASCEFHLYNNTGGHKLITNAQYDTIDGEFFVNLSSSKYTNTRFTNAYLIQCNSTKDRQAGFLSTTFFIDSERTYNDYLVVAISILLIGLFFILITTGNNIKSESSGILSLVKQSLYALAIFDIWAIIMTLYIFSLSNNIDTYSIQPLYQTSIAIGIIIGSLLSLYLIVSAFIWLKSKIKQAYGGRQR